MFRHPRRSVIRPIPFRRPIVLTLFVADVLHAAENRKHFAARAAVLGTELAGEALPVAETPVDDQPGEPLAVDGPPPRRPDRAGFAIVGTMGRRFASRLVVSLRRCLARCLATTVSWRSRRISLARLAPRV